MRAGLGGRHEVVAGRGSGPGRQVEDVEDDEDQQDQARVGHQRRGESFDAHALAPEATLGLVGAPDQDERRSDVQYQAECEDRAEDPQHALVGQEGFEQGAQPVRVVVEVAGAGVDLQVADHVNQHEQCEHRAGQRHGHLERDVARTWTFRRRHRRDGAWRSDGLVSVRGFVGAWGDDRTHVRTCHRPEGWAGRMWMSLRPR